MEKAVDRASDLRLCSAAAFPLSVPSAFGNTDYVHTQERSVCERSSPFAPTPRS